jgi:3-hydroxybutyrate dehydrogenase
VPRFEGAVAVVTGGGSGIGAAVAQELAREGARVVVAARRTDRIERVATEIRGSGGKAWAVHCDVTDAASVNDLAKTAARHAGAVDILVNNAGVQFTASIEDFPDDRWDSIIAINLSGVFHAMKAAIPGMKRRGWGRIVNIASAHGLVASAQKVAYVAAKHGVVGMTKVAAIELANDGITVNAICPGWVLTPLVERQIRDRAQREGTTVEAVTRQFLAEKQPMAQFSSPEQIGALATFLCSDAAKTITGAPLSIDGGWVAQ